MNSGLDVSAFYCFQSLYTPKTVFGWINGTSGQANEQIEPFSLDVGYLKGAERPPGNGILLFTVSDIPGTAGTF